MYETVASSGTNTYDATSGFYIVKITDENGNLATYKSSCKIGFIGIYSVLELFNC